MGAIEETLTVIQDVLAPDLRKLGEQVAALQKALPEMEARLLLAIKASADQLNLKMDYAPLQGKYEALQRKMEDKSTQ